MRSLVHAPANMPLAWQTRTTARCCATGRFSSMATHPPHAPMGPFLSGRPCASASVRRQTTLVEMSARRAITPLAPRHQRLPRHRPFARAALTQQWQDHAAHRQPYARPIPWAPALSCALHITGPTCSCSPAVSMRQWLQGGCRLLHACVLSAETM